MIRACFYGRVSTTDQQSPEESYRWQRSRADALLQGHGQVVAEYFDEGQSRSIPWKRRPEATRLLEALPNRQRGWDAVVIGEPQRAFAGNEFGLVYPVLIHWGVDLWVPEVGGRVDPGSEAHDLVMSLFSGMAKGERNRIKLRVRAAMAAQAKEGRYLGGRPAFGYRLADAGPHPNPAQARDGKRIHRLEPDPTFAPIVRRIFEMFNAGYGLGLIAQRLTDEGIPSPSAADPARNRHHDTRGAWSKTAIRSMLTNPRYTGRMTWRRQSNREVLVDVEDVALGYETKPEWTDPSSWVWSTEPSHEPIIDLDTWAASQARWAAGKHRPIQHVRRAVHPYSLRRLVRCGICGRRMEAAWYDGFAWARCRYTEKYALARGFDHPKNVFLREAAVVPLLDAVLADKLSERGLTSMLNDLTGNGPDDAQQARMEAARRAIEACDMKLQRHHQAIEAGVDPRLVADRMAEVEGERLRAQQILDGCESTSRWTHDDIALLTEALGDLEGVLRAADPVEKHALYEALGVELVYDPAGKVISGRAKPRDWGLGSDCGARGI